MPGPFLCSECPYQTENSYDLTKHELYHSKTKSYVCTTCTKLFTTASDLKRHERTHLPEKHLQCSFQNCSFVTSRSDSLTLHEKTHTGIESRLTHPCPKCSKMFSSNQIASRHLKTCGKVKTNERNSAQETVCHICQKKVSSIYKLKAHVKIHEGRLDFECTLCQKSFVSKYALSKHRLTHEKHYRCEICEKMFSRKDNLQIHLRNHLEKSESNESNNMIVEYICSFCTKHFISKTDLMKHFETDVTCNRQCQDQLYQTEEYPDKALTQIGSDMILTQVVEADQTEKAVYAEIVENNAEIILVDNNASQEVLIIEEPVVYI